MRLNPNLKIQNPKISIIVPCVEIGDYLLSKTIPALKNQSYQNFELILVVEEKPLKKMPSFVKVVKSEIISPPRKRDLGAKHAKGGILSFIDSDVYPANNWLANVIKQFKAKNIAAVVGPGLTPPDDNLAEKVSGYVWESWLGSGGAGTYRNQIETQRLVDDYPTFNFSINKNIFQKASGFNCDYWPGEDTKICHKLVYELKQKIKYCPDCLVYHHRRPVFAKHLIQIGRYAFQRGSFVKIFPENNFKLGYFIPSIFLIWVISSIIFLYFNYQNLWGNLYFYTFLILLSLYKYLMLYAALSVWEKSRNIKITLLFIPAVFLTHIIYGWQFIKGLSEGEHSFHKSPFSRGEAR